MSNREKGLWCVFAGVLALLFLLSSTDLIIKEKKQEVYTLKKYISDYKQQIKQLKEILQ